uniref:Uncharacterized protein n=1 Tax=Ditylenchus dipsaci TaxID=166011 RepID=A0A915ES64_9BILA
MFLGNTTIIAKNILQLEHLEFAIYDRHIDDLELLYPLKKLSSLRLVIIDEEYSNGGSQIDDFYCKRQNGKSRIRLVILLSVENVMQYLRALTHLETFYCTIQRIFKIPPQERPTFSNTSYDFFCNELTDVLLEIDANSSCELKERPKRMFKFQVNSYSRNGDNDLVFKCDRYGNTSYYLVSSDVFWNCTWRIRSIVLREIMEKAFGVRTIRFFANQEGENISLFM